MLGLLLSLVLGVAIWRFGWLLATATSTTVLQAYARLARRELGPVTDQMSVRSGALMSQLVAPVSRGYRAGGAITALFAVLYIVSLLLLCGEAARQAFPLLYYGERFVPVMELLWWPL